MRDFEDSVFECEFSIEDKISGICEFSKNFEELCTGFLKSSSSKIITQIKELKSLHWLAVWMTTVCFIKAMGWFEWQLCVLLWQWGGLLNKWAVLLAMEGLLRQLGGVVREADSLIRQLDGMLKELGGLLR